MPLLTIILFTLLFLSHIVFAETKIHYVLNDHLGRPVAMTDESQNIVWKAESTPFGETTVNEDPDEDGEKVTLNIRFPGQYYDEETGLHYNRHRYYDPTLGRYITSDPIGLQAGANTYGYALQNPINNIDPLGLVTWKGNVVTIGIIYGGGAVRYEYQLESECIDGKKVIATVVAGGPALGIGADAAGGVSGAEFEDNNSVPNANVFNGTAYYAGIGYAFIGIGYQAGAVRLGEAVSAGHGHQMGWDASAQIGAGISTVTDSKEINCECE